MKYILNNDNLEVVGKQYLQGVGGYDGANPDNAFDLATYLPNMVNITYSELKTLRDNSKLVPGQQYRITDYVTTTNQRNTQTAGHSFDIIVIANSNNSFSEVARAVYNPDRGTYFANSNLDAWKIWYCFDNDTERFAWAEPTTGKGVIYRMIDEWNNDCPYDFKNIMFIRYELTTPDPVVSDPSITQISTNIINNFNNGTLSYIWGGIEEGDMYWEEYSSEVYSYSTGNTEAFYTFSNIINNDITDKSLTDKCYSNTIKEYYRADKLELPNIVFFNTGMYTNCHSNSFGNDCNSISLGDSCIYNNFGNSCNSNSFGDVCLYNIFDNNCSMNTFGNNCYFNNFGNSCISNSFGNIYCGNSFGNQCYYNNFGKDCNDNSLGNGCENNSFSNKCACNSLGNNCSGNSLGAYCRSNSFGNDCHYNSFRSSNSNVAPLKDYCHYNHFDDGCSYNVIWNSDTTSSSVLLKNININRGVSGTYSAENMINIDVLNQDYEIQVAKNSNGEIKVYCVADLIA